MVVLDCRAEQTKAALDVLVAGGTVGQAAVRGALARVGLAAAGA